jgi:hypothetical protein
MPSYERVSGTVFAVVAFVQLARIVMGWPVQVDLFTVPIWFSVIAFLVTGGLAIWAFRSAGRMSATV